MNYHSRKLHGFYFEDLDVGLEASYQRRVTLEDIQAFAEVSGDNNPVHLDEGFASASLFKKRIAHGILTSSYISTVIGTKLPGPGCIYLSQSLSFRAPVYIGDEVRAQAKISKLRPNRRHAVLDCICAVGDKIVLQGEALVKVPARPQP